VGFSFEWLLARRYLRSSKDDRFASLMGMSSGIGMVIGVAALIVVLSVMYGFDSELKSRILGFSSHIDIQGPGQRLRPWQEWMRELEKLPEIAQVAPYLSTQVMLKRGSRMSGVMLKGILPEREHQIAAHIRQGRWDSLSDPEDLFQCAIGKDLARKLHAHVGDFVQVLSPSGGVGPSGAMPRVRMFRVAAIFDSGFYEYDVGLVYAPLAAIQRLQRAGNTVSGLAVHLHDREQIDEALSDLRQVLPAEAWMGDWRQRHRSFFQALKTERVAMGVILSLIVLVAVFNMVTSLMIVVMQRRKQIAILKTIGVRQKSLMRIFLLMGMMLSGGGTLVGVALGLLLAWKLDAILAAIESFFGIQFISGDVYYLDHLPCVVDPQTIAVIAVSSLLIGLLATIFPARRASRIPPAEALRDDG